MARGACPVAGITLRLLAFPLVLLATFSEFLSFGWAAGRRLGLGTLPGVPVGE
jgi:hypothetical protein